LSIDAENPMIDPLPLVRDVLDKQIVDCNDQKVGKVDSIVLQLRQHRPPRVVAVESDMVAAWCRVSRRLGRWVDALQRWLAPDLAGPTRIRFEHVVKSGIDVQVDIDATKTNAYVWEVWLEQRVIAKLPGGQGGGEKD
jgi:hypothetical protein